MRASTRRGRGKSEQSSQEEESGLPSSGRLRGPAGTTEKGATVTTEERPGSRDGQGTGVAEGRAGSSGSENEVTGAEVRSLCGSHTGDRTVGSVGSTNSPLGARGVTRQAGDGNKDRERRADRSLLTCAYARGRDTSPRGRKPLAQLGLCFCLYERGDGQAGREGPGRGRHGGQSAGAG